MRCDETNRKMKMMVVLCFFQARRRGVCSGGGNFSILVSGIDGQKQVCLLLGDVVWLKLCLLTLGSVYTIPYHTIPCVVDVFCFCSSFSMRPSSLMGVWCST